HLAPPYRPSRQCRPTGHGPVSHPPNAPAPTASAEKRPPSQCYPLDDKKVPRGGPKPSKAELLKPRLVKKQFGGKIPKTWHTLGVPHNTAVVSCDLTSGNCLGAPQGGNSRKVFYLMMHHGLKHERKAPTRNQTSKPA